MPVQPIDASKDELLARLPASVRDTARASIESSNTMERGPRSTIEPEKKKGHRTLDDAIALLKELGAESAFARRGTLGEGGMGVVHLAEQRALGRDVAVKSVRLDARTADTTLKLLREAWITGALEHPNVVPVHDVRLDADGQPQIVLKKIEGKPWNEVFADRERILERYGSSDPVEWNLRVFLQVAGAVHYAHTRGFVHRDIKPDNVMVGSFGEVYVVDWGLALALADDGTGRFPLAKDARELAGTPCYMAPEMLGGDGSRVDPRTDVYLLGATLFEISTGVPPRDGPNLLAVISKVIEPVEVPEQIPAELAHIIRRAMAIEPSERFESAEALRVAVASYLSHRGSIQLAAEAMERLTELRSIAVEAEADERLDALFTECRFGFQQALRTWPENQLAKDGLCQALRHRIELELRRGNVAFASHLLAELPEADPVLLRRVEEARQKEAAEREKQAAFHRDHDPAIGRRTRIVVGMMMIGIWVLAPLSVWLLAPRSSNIDGYPGAIAGTLVLMGIGLGFFVWARDSLSKTWINRQLVMTVRVTLVSQLALLFGAYFAGVNFDHAHLMLVLVWAIVSALNAHALGQSIDFANVTSRPLAVLGLYPSSVGYAAAFAVLAFRPEWRYPVSASANLVLLVNVLLLWARVTDDVVEPVRRRVREHRDRIHSLPPRA